MNPSYQDQVHTAGNSPYQFEPVIRPEYLVNIHLERGGEETSSLTLKECGNIISLEKKLTGFTPWPAG